jgi:hypothetical protein
VGMIGRGWRLVIRFLCWLMRRCLEWEMSFDGFGSWFQDYPMSVNLREHFSFPEQGVMATE